MQTILLFFLILTAPGVLAAARYRRRFEETLPLSMMGIGVIVFLFGIGGRLLWGVYAAGLIAGLCYLLFVAALIANRKRLGAFCKDFCRAYLSPGFVVFTLLFLGYFVGSMGQKAWWYDDFSHWMHSVKAMCVWDDFITNPNIPLRFASYPPGYSLIQYFVQKLHSLLQSDAAFDEGLGFFAYQIFFTSFFLPLFRGTRFRRPGTVFAGGCLLVCVPLIFYGWIYRTVHADPVLGIAAGCGLAWIFTREAKEKDGLYYASLCLLLFTLVLMKDSGMFFAVFLLLALAGDEWLRRGSCAKTAKILALALLALLLPKLLWSWELRQTATQKVFASSVDWHALFGGDGFYREVLRVYIEGIFRKGMYLFNDSVMVSVYVICLVELAVLTALLHYAEEKQRISARQRRLYLGILILQTLLYTAGLCWSYMTQFSRAEALELASFTRYLGSALLANGVVAALLCFSLLVARQDLARRVYLLAFVCALLLLSPHKEFFEQMMRINAKESITARAEADAFADRLLPYAQKGRTMVILSRAEETMRTAEILMFDLNPEPLYTKTYPLRGDGSTEQTREDWKRALLAENDYVALNDSSPEFIAQYQDLFETRGDIQAQSIYRVDRSQRKLIRAE